MDEEGLILAAGAAACLLQRKDKACFIADLRDGVTVPSGNRNGLSPMWKAPIHSGKPLVQINFDEKQVISSSLKRMMEPNISKPAAVPAVIGLSDTWSHAVHILIR